MCTISKGIIYPVRDPVCFKVLFQHKDGTLVSPFHKKDWKVGETDRTYATTPKTINMQIGNVLLDNCYHTYQYVKDAISTKKYLEMAGAFAYDVATQKVVVCKCTIPKDCMFIYEGECPNWTGRIAPCYASEMLRIDEVIDENTLNKL